MKKLWVAIVLLSTIAVQAENLYGEDLVRRLASPKEIRAVSNIRAKLSKEKKSATPLFVLTPAPFEEIKASANQHRNAVTKNSWDLPPFETLDPALPAGEAEVIRNFLLARAHSSSNPSEVWAELTPDDSASQAPSILLRPRIVPVEEEFVYRIKEIPEPFSLRRYFDQEDVFIELAAYGGTTSFKAEAAYKALKESAVRQQKLEGVGKDAFLTRLDIVEPGQNSDPNALPFAELAPEGDQKPELLDSGSAVAILAPSFNELPVKDLEGKTITFVEKNKKYRDPSKPENSLLVVVAYFPDQAVTVSIAVEERLGNVQDLIAISMLVQKKLVNQGSSFLVRR